MWALAFALALLLLYFLIVFLHTSWSFDPWLLAHLPCLRIWFLRFRRSQLLSLWTWREFDETLQTCIYFTSSLRALIEAYGNWMPRCERHYGWWMMSDDDRLWKSRWQWLLVSEIQVIHYKLFLLDWLNCESKRTQFLVLRSSGWIFEKFKWCCKGTRFRISILRTCDMTFSSLLAFLSGEYLLSLPEKSHLRPWRFITSLKCYGSFSLYP